MTRRSSPSWPLRSVAALVMSGTVGILGCGASSDLHDGGADLSQDGPADVSQESAADGASDAASESPAALGCATVGCSVPPLCALGCQAPCGCCSCAEGELTTLNSVSVRCAGGCYVEAGANACVNTSPTSGPPPSAPGCYEGTAACGWQKVRCACELDVKNPTAAAATVRFALTLQPSSVLPTLTETPDIEVAFDDRDGSWAATWSAQAGHGTTFAVTKAEGKTTVRLGTASLVLTVPLLALQSAVVNGTVHGAPTGTQLTLEAAVTDTAGHHLSFETTTCGEIPITAP